MLPETNEPDPIITPEMAAAGASVLFRADIGYFADEEFYAREVFIAMFKAMP